MSRVIALWACGIALSACAALPIPSFDFAAFRPAPTPVSVRVESEPPGAEAKVGTGAGCRTPCMLSVPGSGTFSVNFALTGYLPQSVPVRVSIPQPSWDVSEAGVAESVSIDPSPVFALLDLAPPPPAPPKRRKPAPRPQQPQAAPAPTFGPAAPPPPGFR